MINYNLGLLKLITFITNCIISSYLNLYNVS